MAEEIPSFMRKLQSKLGLSCILITHDLEVVHCTAHRNAVMLPDQFVAFDHTG